MTVIPDSIEPYLGYKALNMTPNVGLLRSPQQNIEWPPKERLEATCSRTQNNWTWVPVEGKPRHIDAEEGVGVRITRNWRGTPKPTNPLPDGWNWSWEPLLHTSPHEGCGCGIYVVDHPDQCQDYLSQTSVLVEVALWGNTIIADRGARGQYAYPQRLIATRRHAIYFRPASLLYGIPVLIAEDWCDYSFGPTATL